MDVKQEDMHLHGY